MTPRVVLPARVRAALIAHARREFPRECCGLLLGHGAVVTFARPMRNVAADPERRFELDPHEHIDLRRVLRGVVPALGIVGVYHSHPAGPPVPSETDLAEACYPEWVYVVVGMRRPVRIRAYRLEAGHRVHPVPIATPAARGR